MMIVRILNALYSVRLETKTSQVELRMANESKGHPITGHEGP